MSIREPTQQERRRSELRRAYRNYQDQADDYAVAAMCEAYTEVTGRIVSERLREALRDTLIAHT